MTLKTYVDPREKDEIRARQGEDMWVILNHVHPEKRNEFEHFLQAILMPAVAHIEPETYNKVRVLYPTMPNEDGTYTYIFLMDPLVQDGNYNIENILYEFYKPELAEEYIKLFHESLASHQIEYDVIQSAW